MGKGGGGGGSTKQKVLKAKPQGVINFQRMSSHLGQNFDLVVAIFFRFSAEKSPESLKLGRSNQGQKWIIIMDSALSKQRDTMLSAPGAQFC